MKELFVDNFPGGGGAGCARRHINAHGTASCRYPALLSERRRKGTEKIQSFRAQEGNG